MALQDSQIRTRQKKMMPSLYMASVHGRSAQGFPSWLAHLCLSPTRIISRFRRRLVLALVFAHVWGLATMVSAASFSDHEYAVDVWEAEQGLPENTPTAMVQTPDGHLWFSSFGGLVRFDGLTFKLYDHLNTPELPGQGIVNLHLDRNGRLCISALQGSTPGPCSSRILRQSGGGWWRAPATMAVCGSLPVNACESTAQANWSSRLARRGRWRASGASTKTPRARSGFAPGTAVSIAFHRRWAGAISPPTTVWPITLSAF